MTDIKLTDDKYVAHTYGRFPVEIVSGKGSILKDSDGKEYIDMGSGIAVSSFGTADDVWIKAVTDQLNTLQHTSNLFYTSPCASLAKMLCEKTGMKKVFFSNSGAEANECAIKAARRYAEDKKGKDCFNIITLKNSFHGRTVTTLAATGQDVMHEHFAPFPEGFLYAEANNFESVEKLVKENKVAAIMMEMVQGEGGVIPLSKDFVKSIAELCSKEDILLVIDEVQTGNGRTGHLYAYMEYGIMPDIVSTAKGLAGGLPLGATMFSSKTEDVYTPGSHGSTFGGNPVCCAGAISIFERLTDEFLNEVKIRSEYIINELSGASGIKSITGKGLMLGIETEKSAADVLAACRENGVIVLTAKTKVRLLPPLNIPMEALKKAVSVIKDACAL